MAIVTTDNQHYSDIAAAIREKLDTAATYRPAQMAPAIRSIMARCPHADVLCSYTVDALPMTWAPTAVEKED